MTTALVLGKFLPPHAGHAWLAGRARAMADEVVVALLANSHEPIPVDLRHRWLEEMLPWADVRSGVADHRVDYGDPEAYDRWAATIREVTGQDRFDLLLTSEPAYGDETARRLGARHVLVDPGRVAVPVSATAIREDPYANWQYLSPGVRAYYAGRVCLLGAESTGTTTMTRLLAEAFGTAWVPEYGREYSLPKDLAGDTWTTADFEHIAREQQRLEDRFAREADRLLFCDTDALATAIWHEQYLGGPAPSVMDIARTRTYDLTFLTAADFAWVQDGTRNSDAARRWMQGRFEEELASRPEPVVELKGSIDERLGTALAAIERHLGLRPRMTGRG
jgi:NadR type nicotinamide-nucleotide adenylyltransferase